MKKNLLVVALVLVLCANVSTAQVSIDKGFLGGLNFATIGGKDATNPTPENKTGLALGGFISLKLADLLAFEPQLFYMQKGATAKVASGNTTVNLTASYSYLELPVLAKLNIPLAGNIAFKPNIYAGPALAFKLGTPRVKAEAGTQSAEEDIENVTSTDFGLVFGAGANIPIPGFGGSVLLDLRYALGLSSIDDSAESLDLKHRVFSLLIGFSF